MPLLPPRPAGRFDAEILAAIHARCFAAEGGEIWGRDPMASLLATPGVLAWLAMEDGDRPVGLAVLRSGGGESEILTIGVLPAHRRRGHGAALLGAAVTAAIERGSEALFLEVAEDNPAALALYGRLGFAAAGRREGYYRRPEGRADAVILRRDLASD